MKGHVHHVPYPARVARIESLESDLIAAAGLAGVETHPPVAVHYSEGVTVDVFGPWAVG
jgi:predicted metal-dependent phosphotriesterase family hydrolase